MEIILYDFFIFLYILAILANIILGCFIFLKDRKNKLNILFSLFSFSIAIWSFGNFYTDFMYALNNYDMPVAQIIELRVSANMFTTIGSVFQAAFLFHFILVFTDRDTWLKSKLSVLLLYVPGVLFVGIERINPIRLNNESGRISWYALVFYIIVYTLLSLLVCYRYRKKAKNTDMRRQSTLLFIAILIPFIGGISLEVIPRLVSYPIMSLTTTFTTLTALIIFYTIVKYNLMAPLKERLQITEEKYKNLFDTIPDSILLLSNKGTVIEINDTACKNWGVQKNQIIGKPVSVVGMRGGEGVRVQILQKAASFSMFEESEQSFGGKFFQYLFVPTRTFGEEHSVLVIERDVTEQKAAEHKMREANRVIESANETLRQRVEEETQKISYLLEQREQFIIQLSHDLRTPLGPILNLLKIVRSHEKESEKQEMLAVIQTNADYLKNLVNKSIEIARLNSQNAPSLLSEIRVHATIDTYVDNKKYLLKTKGIVVENTVPSDLVIRYDEYEFETLISNLIENAINYNTENGSIICRARMEKTTVEISIQDTGIGMTEQQIVHAFEEFYKADGSRHHLQSTGLGLSICKRIVEKHGGRIWLESAGLGRGTNVFFTVPYDSNKVSKGDV
jgi:PAS domain S-box-containing protein